MRGILITEVSYLFLILEETHSGSLTTSAPMANINLHHSVKMIVSVTGQLGLAMLANRPILVRAL